MAEELSKEQALARSLELVVGLAKEFTEVEDYGFHEPRNPKLWGWDEEASMEQHDRAIKNVESFLNTLKAALAERGEGI